MTDEISLAQKLEILRTALPKGLSAGDGGLTVERSYLPEQNRWPTSRFDSAIESKTMTPRSPVQDIPLTQSSSANQCLGLNLYIRSGDVWIGAGVVASELPSGFDPVYGKLLATSGSGTVWAELNINSSTGAVVSAAVSSGSTVPENTDSAFYYVLGYYTYSGSVATVTNYGCGSVNATICRNWFSNPPKYGVTLFRGSNA